MEGTRGGRKQKHTNPSWDAAKTAQVGNSESRRKSPDQSSKLTPQGTRKRKYKRNPQEAQVGAGILRWRSPAVGTSAIEKTQANV